MMALTIWQPWASLIMAGAKPWEWRGRAAPRSLVGQRIVIHAGARRPTYRDINELIMLIERGEASLKSGPALDLLDRCEYNDFPLASGLGTAILGASIPALDWAREHDKSGLDSGRVDHSKFAWPLTEIRRCEPPIPARGAQGFWRWPHAMKDVA